MQPRKGLHTNKQLNNKTFFIYYLSILYLFQLHAAYHNRLATSRPEPDNVEVRRVYPIAVSIFHLLQIYHHSACLSEIVGGGLRPVVVLVKKAERDTALVVVAQFHGQPPVARQVKSAGVFPSAKAIFACHQGAGRFVKGAFFPYRRVKHVFRQHKRRNPPSPAMSVACCFPLLCDKSPLP